MRRAIPAAPIRLGQCGHIPSVSLDGPVAVAVHRRVIGIGDDDLVPRGLERLCHPFTFGARLEQDADGADSRERVQQPLAGRHHSLLA